MKYLFYTILYISSLLLLSSIASAQSQHVWEVKLKNDFTSGIPYAGKGIFIHENSNQQYVLMAYTFDPSTGQTDSQVRQIFLDSLGQTVQEQKYASASFPNTYMHQEKRTEAVATSDGGYAFLDVVGPGDDTLSLTKLDAAGNVQWQQIYPNDTTQNTVFFSSRLQELNNGDYLISKEFDHPVLGNSYRIVLQRVSSTGVPIWENQVYLGPRPSSNVGNQKTLTNPDYIFEQANGHIIRVFRRRGYIYKYDANGNIISQTVNLGGTIYTGNFVPVDTGSNGITHSAGVYAVTQTADDGIIALTDEYLVEFDSSLNLLRIETIGIYASPPANLPIEDPNLQSVISRTNDGGYILAINNYWYNNQDRTYLVKLDAAWNIEWKQTIYDGSYTYSARFYDIQQTSDNGYILIGNYFSNIWVIKTDSLGRYKTNIIEGNVFTDYDNSCHLDSSDISLQDVILRFKSTTTTSEYYAKTDTNGFYSVDVPKGIYSVELNSPFPFFDTLCPLDSTIVFLVPDTKDTFDIPLYPTISCPMPTVNISAMVLRRGLPSYYIANYCNHGTADVQGVYIEIELDSYFNLDSTSIPFNSQNGNIYTFNIGDLMVGDCDQIFLYGRIDTAAILGQTHCTEARIFPDSVCIPNFWNGPIMQASSSCQNDSVLFQIRNIGMTPATNLQYFVYEDHVIFSIGNIPTLNNGASTPINYPAAPGKTYRIEVDQASGFPSLLGSPTAFAFQEGCNSYNNGSFNTGYVTPFYNGNSSPFVSLNCVENRGSWDPNDKQAQPVGYDNPHYIEVNTPLTYKIRFQNTGTDTAFRVVIIDTLSQYLDPATLQLQVASHPYTWELTNQGVLKVTFNNIMLPDSNANELASHGFIEFTIQQNGNNPLGTVIYNKAGIYFDFNYPIITNQTYHTIGDNFITMILTNTSIIDNALEKLEVNVYPNPFKQQTNLVIKNAPCQTVSLNIYDITGKIVRQYANQPVNQQGNSLIEIHRQDLSQGIYLYQLEGDMKPLQSGKIIVR